jgi:2-hydroxy-6-oxonona-2,4-dienedioate hydrolase
MLPNGEKLATRCGVYALDLPGFGRGAKPRHILAPSELADALASWLEPERLSDVVLVANSFGCQVAVDCAVRHAERIQKLVLAGPTIDASARTAAAQLFRWLMNGRYEPLSLAGVVLRDYMDCGMRRVFRTFDLALEDRIEKSSLTSAFPRSS